MEEVSYSTSCPDFVNEAMRCLLAAPKLHTLELTPRNMTLAPEHMHVLGMLPISLDVLLETPWLWPWGRATGHLCSLPYYHVSLP